MLKYELILSSFLAENTYIAWNVNSRECIVIDPGCDLNDIETLCENNNLTPVAIVNTHAHVDHIYSAAALQKKYSLPFYLHPDDNMILMGTNPMLATFGHPNIELPHVTHSLKDKQQLHIAHLNIEIIHTPGHSPGGVGLKIENTIFSGDTIFLNSIGRTDFPGGDHSVLIQAINERLYVLPDETVLLPGHGDKTTVGYEKKSNPFT